MKRAGHLFDELISPSNLLGAFRDAARGKRERSDVIAFRYDLEHRLLALRDRLGAGTYSFGPYRSFRVHDPKPRQILAAPFEDRVVHHALCRILEPVLEPTFISDSYACRRGKGTHAAVRRLQWFLRGPGVTHVLKADVRKFFQSVDREILLGLLERKIKDRRVLALACQVIGSAPVDPAFGPGKGIPIGNLTSQLFANVYLSPLDHFAKEGLRIKRYVRYVDDLAIAGASRGELQRCEREIEAFLQDRLRLALHPHKCHITKVCAGITFLGYRVWPGKIRVRTTTLVRLRRREKVARRRYWAGEIDAPTYERVMAAIAGHVKLGDPNGALMARIRA